ncbi:hypothetical protein MPLB_390052 [Mesorhizobium sp. ORS 3324]|nr:hypothetical protein MPLB_390052 [Mesorhizobium sp. ORS 3324]
MVAARPLSRSPDLTDIVVRQYVLVPKPVPTFGKHALRGSHGTMLALVRSERSGHARPHQAGGGLGHRDGAAQHL